jgi:hypothetical protein
VNAPALATLTLVWLGAQKPDAVASATLEAWARDHGATLEEPRLAPTAERTGASVLVERCETWLEQARDLLQGGDDEAAQILLVRLDQLLRQHPELLQASWFMAERYRLEARIARRVSPEQALRFEQLAEVTEGARAPAFGEPARGRTTAAEILVALVVHGARRHEIYWDGLPSKDDVATTPGEHHLLVFRGSSVAWGGWVSALGPGKIDVWVPDAAACSTEDFEGVALEGSTRVRPPPDVRCASWVAAAPSDRPGALSIARCEGDRCQPMTTLGAPVATGTTLDERPAASGSLPAWAAWTLAGVGIAAATSIVLWRAGVFDAAPGSKIIYDGSNL